MFTIWLKNYEICKTVIIQWHPFIFYDFRSTNELNIDQYFCADCGKKCKLRFYWFNIIDNNFVCVWGALGWEDNLKWDEMQLKAESGTHNQYLYKSLIHLMACHTSHKEHEILMQSMLCHGSVHNVRIPKLK